VIDALVAFHFLNVADEFIESTDKSVAACKRQTSSILNVAMKDAEMTVVSLRE
jgi:hypothetical protein